MLISEIGIRGFKSFGNNEQTVKLNTEKGELILLVGNNGNGKSSFLSSFEYTLYGKVRGGRQKKWSTLSTLPNRINGELLNRISFKSGGVDVEIKRGISPSKLELWENGMLNERAGKSNIDDAIEKYVGMDIETFKSFISMSINDFKNFISLSNEEKQLLLDKLFNLEVINILNGILKDLNKSNKTRIASLDSEIKTLEDSIGSIQKSIERTVQKEKLNIQADIDELMEQMTAKKDDYKALKEKVDKIKEKEEQLITEIDAEKKQYITVQNDIKNVQREIDLYDSGKCPTCGTDFDSDHFNSLREALVEKKTKFEDVKSTIEANIQTIKDRQTKLKEIAGTTTTTFNDMSYFLKNCKSKIEELTRKKDQESKVVSPNIEEFEKSISELEDKKSLSKDNVAVSKDKELFYKELNRIFGEDGVKKSIIAGIIKPLNHFIGENISKMGIPFGVKLDETFTAEIRQFGSLIESDSLSTGENKRVNIAILIAYLKLIRTKRHINILFLDEVFSSIDIEGIDSILTLLKSFANEYNINIFVVHHAILNQEMFDRILKINKEVFSSIEEVSYLENDIFGNGQIGEETY
jgi:DNA repair exonuclease SbcCD ATPase subunit